MPRKRTPLFKGCYRDRHGVSLVVSVNGKPREFRKNEQGVKYATFTTDELKRERKRIDARESLKVERAIVKGQHPRRRCRRLSQDPTHCQVATC